MREQTQRNRQGVEVSFKEYESIDEASDSLGKNDVLSLVNAGVRRRALVNAGRKGANKLMSVLKNHPELLAQIEALAAENDDEDDE